jgi:hypothetical protein
VKEIKLLILVAMEALLPIVAPLDDVHRDPGKHDARAAGHATLNAARVRTLTKKRGLSLILGAS